MAHFTCAGHTREEIDSMLASMRESGLENILALRGDPPADQPDFDFSRGAYMYARDLVRHICSADSFCIAAAAYVEGHVDPKRLSGDLAHLKKSRCRCRLPHYTVVLRQQAVFRFYGKARAIGIVCPVSAGIMPIFKADQIKSIALKSGCSIPAKVVIMMDKYQHDPEDMRKAGIEYASRQIRELIEEGAEGIHLYTMNRPKSAREIMDNISPLL